MIKGVRIGGMGKALSYLDTIIVPIIDNTPFEEDLKDSMAQVGSASICRHMSIYFVFQAMVKYPDAAGVLVRRHGVYVWGRLLLGDIRSRFNIDLPFIRGGLGESKDTDRGMGVLDVMSCECRLTVFSASTTCLRLASR